MTAVEQPRAMDGLAEIGEVFNSTIGAFALGSAWRLGALDELVDGPIRIEEFAERRGLDTAPTVELFRALAGIGVVDRDGTDVHRGPSFDAAWRTKGFFYWMTRGSIGLFTDLGDLLHVARRGDYARDAPAISVACRDINRYCFDPVFAEIVDGLPFTPTSVVDLGSGSGERLVSLARRFPGTDLLGVDIAADSLAAAGASACELGMADRMSFVVGDVERLEEGPEFADADVVTCFMMGHDLWPYEQCLDTLNRFRQVFPNARRLILGDTARTVGIADTALPIFTLAFELGHAVMGVDLPTLEDWRRVLQDSEWELVAEHPVPTPAASFIFELT